MRVPWVKAPIYTHTRCLPGSPATMGTIIRKEKVRLKALVYAGIRPSAQSRPATILFQFLALFAKHKVLMTSVCPLKLILQSIQKWKHPCLPVWTSQKLFLSNLYPHSWQIYEAHSFAGVSIDGSQIRFILATLILGLNSRLDPLIWFTNNSGIWLLPRITWNGNNIIEMWRSDGRPRENQMVGPMILIAKP